VRSIWKGTIGFGAIAVPVKLYPATEDHRVSFHQIHGSCGSRIRMPKFCPVCNREVEQSELKKGYEVSKGEHIILDDSDFEALPLKSLHSIDILEFIDGSTLDLRMVVSNYFLSPDAKVPKKAKVRTAGAVKAFAILITAMESTGTVGIAKLTMRERERLAMVRPFNGLLLVQTLHYADELRDCSELVPEQVELKPEEQKLAVTLVEAMRGDGDLSKYRDEYRDALEEVVYKKLAGEIVKVPEVETEETEGDDMVEALMASIQATSR